MTLLVGLATLAAVSWLSLLARARWLGAPLPALPAADPVAGDPPLVSILVAVRNERDRTLVPSLTSLVRQDYPTVEVIAVDDHSDDGSRALLDALAAAEPRLRVVDAGASRRGKRAALVTASEHARGAWLLCTDADAWLAPDAVRRAMAVVQRERIDALSLLPRTLTVSLVEQVALAAVAWLAFAGRHLRRANADDAPVGLAAAGPFLLVSMAAFRAIGGYAAIPQNVLIDVALAVRLRAAGRRYRYLRSDGAVETRMYRSLGEIWRGFGKNAALALGPRPLVSLAGLSLVAAWLWLPPAVTLAGALTGDVAASVVALLAAAAMAAMLRVGAAFMGPTPGWLAIALAPVGALLWLAIAAHSCLRLRTTGTVRWKGRALPVEEPGGH